MENISISDSDLETREKLLRTVKKEVKQIMEEAVTRKFVHEESSSITSLCGAVESCLLHGLRKRALGLFKNSTTTALLQKVSKNYEPAAQIVKMLNEIENNNDPNKKSLDNNKNQTKKMMTSYNPKYLWIRLALFEKQLAKIIDHLVQNNSKYYEKEAMLSDPVDGPILASLLVGPCALDYTKMKTPDHFWTDPPADELVQRHRIHSSTAHHIGRPDSPKRPGLQVRRNTSSSSEDSMRTAPPSAKEYVESLHQNTKNTLLYGKNNVHVQPKEDVSPLPGYLSLHQSLEGLTLKWTPNQLMNGCCQEDKENEEVDRRPVYAKYRRWKNGSRSFLYWDYAVTVFLDEIVYLHCHQQPDSGGTIVLVGQDGVQRPPIHFPKGGHLLAFLSCLENGLLPHGQLDPPLWAQRGKGKVFPKLKRKGSRLSQKNGTQISEDIDESQMDSEEEASDYVFRIISTFKPENMPPEMLDPKAKDKGLGLSFPWPVMRGIGTPSPLTQTPPPVPAESSIQTYARTQEQFNSSCLSRNGNHRSVVKQLCDTMKKQIISRAFYGWLAHCRHLKTVRTHLSGLVNGMIIAVDDPYNASQGLTVDIWTDLNKDGVVTDENEIYRLVYYGGCDDGVRKEVWPYLLGHYKFGSTEQEREEMEEALRTQYETTMSEWLAVEAIVRQRDKEIMAASLKRVVSDSNDGHIPLIRKDSSLSNDVFEEIENSDATDEFSHPDTLPEESSTCATTPSTTPHVSAQPSIDRGSEDHLSASRESLISPASAEASNGGVYSTEMLDNVALNLHRIDKDVQRCDRNYWYFTPDNLEKLRNIMCTYVWEHLDVGYVQGMCDLVAPLLVIFDDEAKTYSCFCQLMKRMSANFPHGGAMDTHFANMRSLIQILDSELFEHMHQNGDYTHFYFCYRWFLLDFKRELVYEDVFAVWETIWAAKHISSSHFVLFIALALVEYYRDIILDNNMDFTDIIKFFNEMAERHNAKQVLKISRDLVHRLQDMIENK